MSYTTSYRDTQYGKNMPVYRISCTICGKFIQECHSLYEVDKCTSPNGIIYCKKCLKKTIQEDWEASRR